MVANAGLQNDAWSSDEDMLLQSYIEKYGEGKWHMLSKRSGLNRGRRSCRLRWLNYLKPNINRSKFEGDEVELMMRLHKLLGNRWELIAGRLPGRTANDVKNYWNTHIKKSQPLHVEPSRPKTHCTLRPQPRSFTDFHTTSILPADITKTEDNTNSTIEELEPRTGPDATSGSNASVENYANAD